MRVDGSTERTEGENTTFASKEIIIEDGGGAGIVMTGGVSIKQNYGGLFDRRRLFGGK